MREKLIKVRELNARIVYMPRGGSFDGYMCATNMSNNAKEALLIIDEMLNILGSKQLTEKMCSAIGGAVQKYEQHIQDNAKAEDIAEIAATEAILVINEQTVDIAQAALAEKGE